MLVGLIYNNVTYYYIRTLTGELTKILTSAKEVVGEYYYDAYGNILNISSLSSIAQINPYRYKGYYYDQETNLYYCKSRYYSPEIYRWISRDEIEYLDPSSITGCNLYAYCNNNPVMYMDENGNYCINVFDLLKYFPVSSETLEIKLLEFYNVDVKYSVTTTLNSRKGIYETVEVGDNYVNNGIGYSNSLGTVEVYSCNEKGFGGSVSTNVATSSIEYKFDEGLTFSGGVIIDNQSHELSVTITNEYLALTTAAVALACTPIPYGRLAGALVFAVACCVLVISNINLNI